MSGTPGEALDSWLPAPGSDLYYAHLYAPNGAKRTLLTIASLRQAIAGIPASCSAPTIALPKLAWWRDELGQLARGTPRHAITRGLIDLDPALPAAGLALTLRSIRPAASVTLAERFAIARRPDVLATLAVTVITISGAGQ